MNITPINHNKQNNKSFGMQFRYKDNSAREVLMKLLPRFEQIDKKLIPIITDKNGTNFIATVSTINPQAVQFEARGQRVVLSQSSTENTVRPSKVNAIVRHGGSIVKVPAATPEHLFYPTLEVLTDAVNSVTRLKKYQSVYVPSDY